jgi:CubicO group peptidase (beta-lactamase class C family)
MRWLRRLIPYLIIIAATALIIYLPDRGPEKYSSLSELFKNELQRQMNTGISVVVTRNGRVVYKDFLGNDGLGTPLAEDSPMYLGPGSEIFTGALLFSLASTGSLDLDTGIDRYLPNLFDEGSMTIRQLAAHSLPLDDKALEAFQAPSFGIEAGELDPQGYFKARIESRSQARSRLVYRVLGQAIENAGGSPFDELLQERVLIPLGMHGTTSKPDSIQGGAIGSGLFFGLSFPYESRVATIAAPADGIVTTAGDLGRFLSYISSPPRNGVPSLPRSRLPELFMPLLQGGDTGYGWRLAMANGKSYAYQGGSVVGFSSRVVVWPEQRASVAILSSQGGIIQSNVVLPLLTAAAEDILFEGSTERLPPLGRIMVLAGVASFVYLTSIFLQTAWSFSWARALRDRRETSKGNLLYSLILLRTAAGTLFRGALLAIAPIVASRIVGRTLIYHDLLTMEPGITAMLIVACLIGILRNLARLIWFYYLERG